MPGTYDDPEQRRAFERGRRDATIDAQLLSHEKRLSAINGSIERHATNAAALRDSIEEVRDGVDEIRATLTTNSLLEAERTHQLKRANEKQISSRTFWTGVALVVVPIIGIIVTLILTLTQHHP